VTATAPPGDARRLLRSVLGAVRRDVVLCVVAGLAWQAVAVAVPWVLERAVDDGIVAGDTDARWRWAAVLVALGVLRWAGDAARHWWVERAGAKAADHLRRRVVDRVLAMGDDELARFGHGDLVARSMSDTGRVWDWVAGIATLATAGFTLAAVLVLLVTLDWSLALIGVATVPLAAGFSALQVGAHGRAAAGAAAATGAYTGAVESAIAGARTVKGLGAEAVVAARADDAGAALAARQLALARVEGWWVAAAAAIPAAGLTAGLWFGGTRALAGHLTVGTLVAFAGWMALLVVATATLTERLIDRGAALAAAARLAEVLAPTQGAPAGHRGPVSPPSRNPEVLAPTQGAPAGHRGPVSPTSRNAQAPTPTRAGAAGHGGGRAVGRRPCRVGAVEPATRRIRHPVDPPAPSGAAGGDRPALPTGLDLAVDGATALRGGRPVLRDVDLDVGAGRWLALVGPTGGGKSTLLRLLAGLDVPAVGRVLVGGDDIGDLDPAERRRRVTLVPQGAAVTSGPVGELLRLGAPEAGDGDLWRALAAAAAAGFVDALGGLAAAVGERGLSLSGGQRQRLALAAAVVRRPPVLVLDDVTSALDPDTEAEVLAALRRHLPATTVVVATHRAATAAACDQVALVADGGVVLVSAGDAAALLAAPHDGRGGRR
jgi:ATP-binding cassette subfamily B protein